MDKLVTGIHHVTALASDAQKNVNFYAGILGLRLVKKTINFDAPSVYHLYYGNESGAPGTILTFFLYREISKGRKGIGQVTVISFSIHESAVDFWIQRLKSFHIPIKEVKRSNELTISFEDHDGLGLELVANRQDQREGYSKGNVPAEMAIKGFFGIALTVECHDKTAHLLSNQMDHQLISQAENRFRYSAGGKTGEFVDIICKPDALKGIAGSGTVHHVAFATATEATQLEARAKLCQVGFNVTPVLDRQYFRSIYFREPGGVLFEIATIPPGFTIDEPLQHLGESLKLPPWEEANRKEIEKYLRPIH